MLSSGPRIAVRVGHHPALEWPILLSLALHLTLLLSAAMIPGSEPTPDLPGPISVEMVLAEGSADAASGQSASGQSASGQSATADLPKSDVPMPDAPMPVAEPQAETPPLRIPEPISEPAPPPTPPLPPTPIAPPAAVAPAEIAPEPAPPPAVPLQPPEPAPPAQPVSSAPVPPAPVPPAPPLPARPAAPVHPTPQRAAARAPLKGPGPTARATGTQDGTGPAAGGGNGAAWMGRLKQWWDQHSFYPAEASLTNEGGNVKVHIAIAPDGRVTSIGVVQSSGLAALDTAALAVFRNAHLPPLPPGASAQPADVVVTLHYRPSGNGG
jgi:periplasmic protein TonB